MAELYITNAVAQGMLNGTGFAESLGASPKIRLFSGTKPSNADASLSGNTQLAELLMAASPFSGFSDTGTAGRATAAAISSDNSADATGTCTFGRIYDNAGTTVKCQFDVGTSGTSLIMATVSLVSGAVVAISSFTLDLTEGP